MISLILSRSREQGDRYAAAQCFIAQSAISRQVQTLEQEPGAEQLCQETKKIGEESSPHLVFCAFVL